jgi:hypothetical protein
MTGAMAGWEDPWPNQPYLTPRSQALRTVSEPYPVLIIALYGQALRTVSEPYPVLIIALYGQALRTVSE